MAKLQVPLLLLQQVLLEAHQEVIDVVRLGFSFVLGHLTQRECMAFSVVTNWQCQASPF